MQFVTEILNQYGNMDGVTFPQPGEKSVVNPKLVVMALSKYWANKGAKSV